ncbi:TIGR01777 family oxidoreductase [Bacillus sp. REN10]|uniref:TIGR01777 family oxidoreductase n=1 Tax=Bacillus sp. REN10 TaxID=2782541 RepID=UPI00193B50C5|nr:TIGR01777 family oxidoreductase [Bacillus sp. REN10]
MKVAIAGGTGFVGKALTIELLKNGYEVYVLTRNTNGKTNTDQKKYVKWMTADAAPEQELQNVEIFINLAGESLNSGRWTEERKQRILESRISSTKEVLRIMGELPNKPEVLINASAIGYYPISNIETFTEASSAAGNGFLAHTVKLWEEVAQQAETLGIRTVLTRFGVILGKEDGALPRMALPYQLFVGGTVGSGKQWMSWIHLTDVARAIVFAIENKEIHGPVNVTAPSPETMERLGKALAKTLHRPHWLFVPSIALKVILGEMSTLVLDGQRVLPEKLLSHQFTFQFPDIHSALQDIYT